MGTVSSDHDPREFTGTDRFEVRRCLGAGGMGVVYESWDRERGQRVALKTLQQVDPQAIFRLKREFRSLAEIVHPNLIALYELISDGDRWFFTMELIEGGVDFLEFIGRAKVTRPGIDMRTSAASMESGETLKASDSDLETDTLISRPTRDETEETRAISVETAESGAAERPVDPAFRDATPLDAAQLDRLRQVMRQLVEGVSAIHRVGKLHRDLKPGNVMVRSDGSVVILDFGLVTETPEEHLERANRTASAMKVSGTSYSTSDGFIVGTGDYMSPEQAGGEQLNEASDWYSVGVMLFAALTGKLPFEGGFWDILRLKRSVDAPAPKDLVPDVPDDLNDLCVDLMRRDPDLRPDVASILARLGADSGSAAALEPEIDEAPFVGRQTQMARLKDGFEFISGGGTAVFEVFGKSGTGKSALIEHFFDDLSRNTDALILAGRCYERESVPYKAIDTLIDALTSFLLQRSSRGLRLLVPPNISALARIFPVLNRIEMIASSAGESEDFQDLQELRRLAFQALREMLGRISEIRPLVLYIDDLQWGDNDSAELLLEILKEPVPRRLLLLLAYRSEYASSNMLLRSLDKLGDNEGAGFRHEKIHIEPFSREDAVELAQTLIGNDDESHRLQAERIADESGGSPYFVYELVRHLKGGAALGEIRQLDLDEVLWRRAQRLPEEARRLLEVIAVNSQPIELRYAQQASGSPGLSLQMINDLRSQHLVRSTGPGLQDQFETYHDRIRESLLARIAPEVRVSHHAALADTLVEAAPPELLGAHCQGAGRLADAGRYFEQAADQAIRSLAFDRADDYFKRAESLAGTKQSRASIREKRIHFYTDLARFRDAYDVGYIAVREFGLKIPPKFHPPSFARDLVAVRLRLGRRKIPELIDLPTVRDEDLATGMRLMAAVGKVAYQLRPELCISIMARLVGLCLRHGNLPDAAIGYVAFGTIFLGGILGRYKTGSEFGKLALDLVEKYDNKKLRAEVLFLNGYFGTSWLRPAVEAERFWDRAWSAGLESGDLFHTGCASCATIMSRFMRGVRLDEVWRESDKYLEFLRRSSLREPLGALQAVRQAIRCLRGETTGPDSFETPDFDEKSFVDGLGVYGSRHFAHYYYIVKMQTLYLAGDYKRALEFAHAGEAFQGDSRGMLHSAEHMFWKALIIAAQPEGGLRERLKIASIHRKFRRWAGLCPENFLARERLIAGELSRIKGDRSGAAAAIDEAEAAAGRHEQTQIAALAANLAAGIHRLNGDWAAEQGCRDRARQYYRDWGASIHV